MVQTIPPLRRASSENTIRTFFPLLPLRTPKPLQLDADKSANFLSHITRAINDSATCIQLSLGHQLNLLPYLHDTSNTSPATTAKELNLSNRYVEEWIAAISCTDIKIPRNGAVACMIPALARAETELIQAFRDGRPANVNEVHTLAGELYPKAEQLLKLYPGLADSAHVGVIAGMRVRLVEDLAKQAPSSWFSVFSEKKRKSFGNLHWCDWNELSGRGYLDVVLVVDGAEVGREPCCVQKFSDALRPGGVLLFVDVCGGGGAFGGALGIANGGCGGREMVERRLEEDGFDVVDVHTISEMCYVIVAMAGGAAPSGEAGMD